VSGDVDRARAAREPRPSPKSSESLMRSERLSRDGFLQTSLDAGERGQQAVTCWDCEKPIEGVMFVLGAGDRRGLRCLDCWGDPRAERLAARARPCEGGCGRPVVMLDGRFRHATCSPSCHREARASRRRVPEHEPRRCSARDCPQSFVPTRTDSRYCSNACRQREHRRGRASR
jgi:hypothetical protein